MGCEVPRARRCDADVPKLCVGGGEVGGAEVVWGAAVATGVFRRQQRQVIPSRQAAVGLCVLW